MKIKLPPVTWIVSAAFLLRLAMLLPGWSDPMAHYARPDTVAYLEIARSLAAGAGYCTAVRPPGYPLLGALCYRLAPDAIMAEQILALLGVLAGTLTVYVIYRCGKEYGSERIGLAAALLGALNLTMTANAPMLLTDTFFGVFAAVQFLFFLRFTRSRAFRDWGISVGIAALGALIRPINMVWLPAALAVLAFDLRIPFRRRLLLAGAGAAVFLAVITPWMLRNALTGNGFTIDTNTGAMYQQNGAMLLAELKGSDFESEKAQIRAALAQEFQDTRRYPDEAARERYRKHELLKLIGRHPWIFLKQSLVNWRVLLPDAPTLFENLGVTTPGRGTMGVLAKSGVAAAVDHYFEGKTYLLWLVLPLIAVTALTYLGCLVRLLADLRNRNSRELLLFAAFALYYLVLPGAICAPRYQIPALPAITLFAALAGADLYRFLRRKRKKNKAA